MAGTLTVACKIPNGIILRTGAFREVPVSVMGGGVRMERQWEADGKSIELKGPNHVFGQAPKVPVAGGYGLNHNIDADLWARWFEDNKESDLVKNQMIFASVKRDTVEQMAGDRVAVRSGPEPIIPDKDPRTRSLNQAVEVKTDDARSRG